MATLDHQFTYDKSADPQEVISGLRKSRGIHKRKLTLLLKQVAAAAAEERLTSTLHKSFLSRVNDELQQVKIYDDRINSVIDQSKLLDSSEEFCQSELEEQIEYISKVDQELSQYEEEQPSGATGELNNTTLVDLMGQMSLGESRPPPLTCGTFSGKEKDKFAFSTFLSQFNNVIGSRKNLSNASK